MKKRIGVCLVAIVLLLATYVGCAQENATSTPTVTLAVEPTSTVREQVTTQATDTPLVVASPATPTATATTPLPPATPTETVESVSTVETGAGFDGELAFDHLEAQLAFGPRWPGSPGHGEVGDYIVESLEAAAWTVEEQRFEYQGVQGRNIIGKANEGEGPIIIIGAHYDSRRIADQTPGAVEEQLPVPGAVDGASGAALLLELARTLDLDTIRREVWLAFFDMEDNGGGAIAGWDWIVGSSYMAENLQEMPEAMVLVDMIGDADQQLYYEGNSDPQLREELWNIAAELGYEDAFIPQLRYTMIDDHVPFARRGIPAVDIIDFDYPYWHTVDDTADKASAESLERVGRTIEFWLEREVE